MLLADAESFARAQNIFKPESFDRKLQPIAKFVKDYMDEYKVMPDVEQVNAKHDIKLKSAEDLDPAHFNWLLDDVAVNQCQLASLANELIERINQQWYSFFVRFTPKQQIGLIIANTFCKEIGDYDPKPTYPRYRGMP